MSLTPRALLIRMDRLGDLILTLPVDQNAILKNYDCTWFITQGLGFVAEHSSPPKKFQQWKRDWSWSQFKNFLAAIKTLKPEVSVSFHVPWWVNLALFVAGVPSRIGVLSQWHSYLFLNKGVRQKRSDCQFHEMEYNNRLVFEGLGKQPIIDISPLRLKSTTTQQTWAPSPYVIVHPGMGGSALNWPLEHYRDLISLLSAKLTVVITGTSADAFIINPLKEKLQNNTQLVWLDGKLKGGELITLISQAKALVAPSTGVVHIAASLGVPTIGLYSPIKVESAKRWGPRGDFVQVFSPQVEAADSQDSCMDQIPPIDIARSIFALLS